MRIVRCCNLAGFFFLLDPIFPTSCLAQGPAQYTLEIYSTGMNVSATTLGHAFMSIKVKTGNGYKEDAFGFYSEPEARGVKDIPRLIIGMPGALQSEFDRHPERFAKVEETLQIPITEKQRRDIYKVVEDWDKHDYALLSDNCIEFVSRVAEQVGIPGPSRTTNRTANQYVAALKNNYKKKEEDRIEAEERERQRQKQAKIEAEREKQEKARIEAEQKRQEQQRQSAAAAEARRIPSGWVPCSCPAVHAPYGKYVNGILYHPNNVRCP